MPRDLRRAVRVWWILTGIVVVTWLVVLIYFPQNIKVLIGLGTSAVSLALVTWHLERAARTSERTWAWRQLLPGILKAFLMGITLVLLSSVGTVGGLVAYTCPVLLLLHFLAARSSRTTAEVLLWAVLAAATAYEAIWIATFVAVGETLPWIWLLPTLAVIVAGTMVFAGGARFVRRISVSH